MYSTMYARGLRMYSYQGENLVVDMSNVAPIEVHLYDVISGEKFLNYAEDRLLIDYDGRLDCVLVDGYKTNLGLSHKGVHQGELKLTESEFRELCKSHHVLVNWVNK